MEDYCNVYARFQYKALSACNGEKETVNGLIDKELAFLPWGADCHSLVQQYNLHTDNYDMILHGVVHTSLSMVVQLMQPYLSVVLVNDQLVLVMQRFPVLEATLC